MKLLCSVQRKPGETLAPGELCAPDAPIDLRPKNLDGETPEDLAAEISPVDGEEKKDHGRIVREIISGEFLSLQLGKNQSFANLPNLFSQNTLPSMDTTQPLKFWLMMTPATRTSPAQTPD